MSAVQIQARMLKELLTLAPRKSSVKALRAEQAQ
jgi:hypothetical protein